MTDLSRHCLLLVATAVALAACTKKDEQPAVAAAASAASAASATTGASAAASAVQVRKPDPLKVAWVYAGPIADAGATAAHDRGRKAVQTQFTDAVQATFIEKVPEGARGEGAIRDLAAKGNKLIFATSAGYAEPVLKVAGEFPDVRFEVLSGPRTADNIGAYDVRTFEVAYLAGVMAGQATKTHVLGFVGSLPIPQVLRNLNAFTLGAQSVNPRIRTKVSWVHAWFDPVKEGEAAQGLITGGADVLLQNTDSTAVLQTAERNGKHAFGWASDMSGFAPKAHLASLVIDWGVHYKRVSQAVIDGSWVSAPASAGIKEGQLAVVKIADIVPIDVKERVATLTDDMKRGSFAVFSGPVVDASGKERLPKGAMADQAWLDKMDFYVRGVDGKVPALVRVAVPKDSSGTGK